MQKKKKFKMFGNKKKKISFPNIYISLISFIEKNISNWQRVNRILQIPNEQLIRNIKFDVFGHLKRNNWSICLWNRPNFRTFLNDIFYAQLYD
jgi:hypothetical protein